MRQQALGIVIFTLLAFSSQSASASYLDDIFIEYSLMHIDEVKVGDQIKNPTFLRHNLELSFGLENFTLGLIYQHTDKSADTVTGVSEEGVMATLGYYQILTDFLSLDSYARIGLTPHNDPSQQLYATDTDVRAKLVLFEPDGWGSKLNNPVFPSMYAGAIVNRYGRTQAIAGAGVWWHGLSTYLTGYYSFNGVKDPFSPGDGASYKFASLKNSGVTGSLGYDLQIPQFGDIKLEVRQNIPFENAGNDLRISIGYRYLWSEQIHKWGKGS
jgi:hypothetical protein